VPEALASTLHLHCGIEAHASRLNVSTGVQTESVSGPHRLRTLEVNMSATMTIMLSVSLFASFFFVSRSDDQEPDKSRRNERDQPTGYEIYV
jgi:hypothetical protein